MTSQITSKWEFQGDRNSLSQMKYDRKNHSTFSVRNIWNSNFIKIEFTHLLHTLCYSTADRENKGQTLGKTATSVWFLKLPSFTSGSLAIELWKKSHLSFFSKLIQYKIQLGGILSQCICTANHQIYYIFICQLYVNIAVK